MLGTRSFNSCLMSVMSEILKYLLKQQRETCNSCFTCLSYFLTRLVNLFKTTDNAFNLQARIIHFF